MKTLKIKVDERFKTVKQVKKISKIGLQDVKVLEVEKVKGRSGKTFYWVIGYDYK